jgi:hypothetical protein
VQTAWVQLSSTDSSGFLLKDLGVHKLCTLTGVQLSITAGSNSDKWGNPGCKMYGAPGAAWNLQAGADSDMTAHCEATCFD